MAARVFLLVVGLVASLVTQAAEVPYAVLYQALAAVRAAQPFPRLRAVQRVESKLPGVSPSDIRVVVRAAAGEIAVPIAGDGTLAFPLDDKLVAENPVVVTNQPAGSLTLLVSVELPVPGDSRLLVPEVLAALDEAQKLFSAAGAGDTRTVRGVEIRFDGADGSVTVRGETERLLVPDADGRVLLMRDSDLASAREIELGGRPKQVLPFLER